MKGKWTGTYTYSSKRFPEEFRNRVTQFEVDILDFDGQGFSGSIQDDLETGGTKGTGTVKGTVKNGIVEFIKEMPIQTVRMPDGSKIEEEKPHRKIYYTGKISNNEMEGTWKFKFGFGKVNNRWAIFTPLKGNWTMTKKLDFD